MRFGKSIRYFCSILFTVGMILYLPVAIYVPALTFSQVSGLGVHTVTPIVCLVCTFYTCVGGLKAVVWTDAVQSFVMYGTILTICIKGTIDLGGLQLVLERNYEGGRLNIPDLTWDPRVRISMTAMILGGTLHKIQSNDVNQMSIQRFMSLPDIGKVKQCLILFTVLLAFLLFCCCYMGLLTYATYYQCDPLSTKLAKADDQLPTILVMNILGVVPGLPGLFVAGVFSAALSSLSTGLNSMACVISEDLIKPFINLTEKQNGFLLRFIVAFFGLGCIGLVFIVEKMGTVLQLATMTGAVTMGPILGFYTAGICMPWIKEKSILLGGIVSFATLSWICVNAQMGQMSGDIRHPKLPVSIEDCSYDYNNDTAWERQNYTPSERNIYHLSFMWYTGLGGIICCVVANIASFAFGFTKPEDINPDLISPVLRRFLPEVVGDAKVVLDMELKEKEPLYKFDLESEANVKRNSLHKYLEMRFDRRLRFFGSVMYLIGSILWLPISIYVPALTFNQVTGINLYSIIPVVCIVCTIYTCIGGIKGVIWTDVLQAIIMVGSLLFVAIKGTYDVGGLAEVYQRNLESGRLEAPEWTFDPTVRMGFFAVLVGGTLLKIQNTYIDQSGVQRFLSLPSMKEVTKSLFIIIIGLILLLGLCIYMGLLAYAKYFDCDPITTRLTQAKDQIVPLYVMQTVGNYPGIPGLFISGVFSAALSSLSSCLNSLSGVVLKDFVEPYRSKSFTEKQTAIFLRAIVLIFGFSAMALVKVVEKLGMVMQLSATVTSITSGPLLGVFTVGMTLPWIKSDSTLTGCITAVLVMGYVAIRSQIDTAMGILTFPTKPVSIEGCTYDFEYINQTLLSNPVPATSAAPFHHISFLWYTGLGAGITIVISLLATLYFGKQDSSEVDPKLIVPKLRKYLNEYKYTSVPQDMDKIQKVLAASIEMGRREKQDH